MVPTSIPPKGLITETKININLQKGKQIPSVIKKICKTSLDLHF